VSANAPAAPNKPPPDPVEKKLTFFFPKSMKSYLPSANGGAHPLMTWQPKTHFCEQPI
jgi:hypothetical protein